MRLFDERMGLEQKAGIGRGLTCCHSWWAEAMQRPVAGRLASAACYVITMTHQTKLLVLATLALLLPGPARSQDSDLLAVQLAGILAAEHFCQFTYDQAGIQTYIERNVSSV